MTKQITTQVVANCSGEPPPPPADTWYFRGTPNAWGTTAMTTVSGTSQHTITMAFAKEDPSPRFKVDHHGDWTENYPAQDIAVADCAEYEIVFDSSSKAITHTWQADVTTGACASRPPPPPPSGADIPRRPSISS